MDLTERPNKVLGRRTPDKGIRARPSGKAIPMPKVLRGPVNRTEEANKLMPKNGPSQWELRNMPKEKRESFQRKAQKQYDAILKRLNSIKT